MTFDQEVHYIKEQMRLKGVAHRLGKYNLLYLLQLISYLSILSASEQREYAGFGPEIYYHFSPGFISRFCKAILLSNSKTTKKGMLDLHNFIAVYNQLGSVVEMIPNDESKNSIYHLLASVANSQALYQNANYSRELGRTHLLFDIIPEKYNLVNDGWIDCFGEFKHEYGVDFDDVYMYMIQISARLIYEFQDAYDVIKMRLKSNPRNVVQVCLSSFNHCYLEDQACAVFDFTVLETQQISHNFLEFILMHSQSSKRTNSLMYGIHPKKVVSDWNPFRNFPFVQVEKNRVVVPSIFELSLFGRNLMMDYVNSLDAKIKNLVKTNLGLCYEKYVLDYIQLKHSNLMIIPEANFSRSDKGPDIMILNPADNKMVLIEVKSRHLRQEARQDPLIEFDDKGLITLLVDTMYALTKKLDRIRSGEGDYHKYLDHIRKCHDIDIYLLTVCGDYGFFLDGMIYSHYLEKYKSSQPSKQLFLDLQSIENLIEYTSQNSMTLFEGMETLISCMKRERHDTNTSDVFTDYNRELAPWYPFGDAVFRNYTRS